MLDQRRAPSVARFCVAKRVELQRHAVVDAELSQQLIAERQQLHVRRRFGCADHLGVELVELAEAALLRAFVAEGGAMRRKLERRELLPALAEIGAANAGRELGPKRDLLAAAILEGVHLLGDDVGGLADRPGEDRGLLDDRNLDALESEQPAHAIERVDHRVEAVGVFSEQALGPANGLRRIRHLRADLGGELQARNRGDDGEDQEQPDRGRRLVEPDHSDGDRANGADAAPHGIGRAHRDGSRAASSRSAMLIATETRKAIVHGTFRKPSTKRSDVVKPTSNSPPRISQNQAIRSQPPLLQGASILLRAATKQPPTISAAPAAV